jgi:hypothetical protein
MMESRVAEEDITRMQNLKQAANYFPVGLKPLKGILTLVVLNQLSTSFTFN